MNPLRWLSALLLALALVAGAMLWLQRQAAAELRGEIALLRDESRELARLRKENQRLAAALPPAAELESLRADRAAIGRMRSEIDALNDSLQKRERALAEPRTVGGQANVTGVKADSLLGPPALVLALRVSTDGGLSLDGMPADLNALRSRLAVVPKGESVEIRYDLSKSDVPVLADTMKQINESLSSVNGLAKELGLKLRVQVARTPQ